MSGLTVGYLSIDHLTLELKLKTGTEVEKAQVRKIMMVIKNHHLLLVTLLISNAAAMETLPIFLDKVVPSFLAIIISVTAVLSFGEIIPQALCTGPSQYRIASALAPLVFVLIVLLWILAYPISKLLDCLLGHRELNRFNNSDLKALIGLHSIQAMQLKDHPDVNTDEVGLRQYQTKMIEGIIDIKTKTVSDLMIASNKMFSLDVSKKVNNRTAKKIARFGFSRIPVYKGRNKNKIIGIMLIKSLIGVDLSEERTFGELIHEGEITLRKPFFVKPEKSIESLVIDFRKGRSHMAIVSSNAEDMNDALLKTSGRSDSFVLTTEDYNKIN